MSGFAALMKLSQSQTAQSELAIQTQIASHQVQLEKKRREQEAKERKERELEAKLRAKRFEEQRKEEERKRKRAEEEEVRRRELEKREEQIRDALKYGPKKVSLSGSSSKSKGSDKGDDNRGRDVDFDSGSVLTREEKRQRKLDAHLRRAAAASSSSRRSGGGSTRTALLPDGRMVRKLPGGAVDVTTASRLDDPDAASSVPPQLANQSTRARLAAMPSTLVKLNTVKRDTRSIDDYLSERAKIKQNKVLAGEDAKDFSDWFGKSKKKSSTPQLQQSSSSPSRAVSATPSGSPAPTANPPAGSKTKSAAPAPPPKAASFLKPINPRPIPPTRTPITSSASSATKKRPRSPSSSSPPPAKRRPSTASRPATSASTSRPPRREEEDLDIRSHIWSLFGKDRKAYTARDVLSDDEDMEADTQSVLKEEARSARLAHKEDEYALAEEKRHEEEKRRRKKERERKERA